MTEPMRGSVGEGVRLRKFIPPTSIVVFLVLTFLGAYYVRLCILERHMVAAMDMKDKAAVAELANSWPCPVKARGEYERTPLHLAAGWGDCTLVELLLRKGADINAKDCVGKTPLHGVAECGREKMVEFLIAKGANINAKAIVPDMGDMTFSSGETPLHCAVTTPWTVKAAEILITKGADVNARDDSGETPLHWAARSGQKEAVELLIAKGANISAKDSQGRTALGWAIDQKHDAVEEVLRKAGAAALPSR